MVELFSLSNGEASAAGRDMGAEIVEERLAVKGSVACAGVPTGTSFVDPVVTMGDRVKSAAGSGGGGDVNP